MAGRKKIDIVNQDTSKYFKRARKSVDYNEDDSDDEICGDGTVYSGSDFEVKKKSKNYLHNNIQVKRQYISSANSKFDVPLKFNKSKSSIRVGTKIVAKIDKIHENNSVNTCTSIKPSSFINIGQPHLSECESSDSSDEDIPLAQTSYHKKKKIEENAENDNEKEFIIDEKDGVIYAEENIEKENVGSENIPFMETEDGISLKSIKFEDPSFDESIGNKTFSLTIKKFTQTNKKANVINIKEMKIEESSEESENNWEDVDEIQVKTKAKKRKRNRNEEDDRPNIKELEISVDVESIHAKKKRKTREEQVYIWIRQLAGRIQKERQILLHKCHLLCLLANALSKNGCCNNTILKAICLSLIPKEYFKPVVSRWDINHLRRFTTWFQKDIPSMNELLLYIDQEGHDLKNLERIHVFIIMIRSLGFLARIINSLQPCSAKVKKSDVSSNKNGKKTIDNSNKIKNYKKQRTGSAATKSSKQKLSKKKEDMKSPYFSDQCNESEITIIDDSKSSNKDKATRHSSVYNKSSLASNQNLSDVGNDIWAEVYLETLCKWVCLELLTETINAPNKCEAAATKPLQYVIGIDNNQHLKDVTCRYAEKWLTLNRKLRVDRDWWAESIDPYKQNNDTMNSAEDAQMKHHLMQKDLPKTISEFKDNPLYVLQRHLLKFQAIYPESAVPVGYIHSEPIYPREFVQELHSREAWMKKARCVIPGEEPYKIVKGRTKLKERHVNKEVPQVPLFGLWQTEVYLPPPVKDGKVTKNEYGNIELYQPSMLPEGAVHLPMTNMLKIAGKLKIDCAPALMRWDFHCGFSHPVFEGIVVAKEYEDVLLDAWNQEEEERERKEKQKREKVIYENWKKLIRGLLIRVRLKNKHALLEVEQNQKIEVKGEKKGILSKKKRGEI